MFCRYVQAKAFGTQGEVIDGHIRIDAHSHTSFELENISAAATQHEIQILYVIINTSAQLGKPKIYNETVSIGCYSLASDVGHDNFDAYPIAPQFSRAPPQCRCDVLLLLHFHHRQVHAARILAVLMHIEAHHT